jgi:hypothetical protein
MAIVSVNLKTYKWQVWVVAIAITLLCLSVAVKNLRSSSSKTCCQTHLSGSVPPSDSGATSDSGIAP